MLDPTTPMMAHCALLEQHDEFYQSARLSTSLFLMITLLFLFDAIIMRVCLPGHRVYCAQDLQAKKSMCNQCHHATSTGCNDLAAMPIEIISFEEYGCCATMLSTVEPIDH